MRSCLMSLIVVCMIIILGLVGVFFALTPPDARGAEARIQFVTLTPPPTLTPVPPPPTPPPPTATPDAIGPPAPELVFPSANSVVRCGPQNEPVVILFEWRPVNDPAAIKHYQLRIGSKALEPQRDVKHAVTVDCAAINGSWPYPVTWQVHAVDGAGNVGQPSRQGSFTIVSRN